MNALQWLGSRSALGSQARLSCVAGIPAHVRGMSNHKLVIVGSFGRRRCRIVLPRLCAIVLAFLISSGKMHVTYRRAQLVQGTVLEHFTFLRVHAMQASLLRGAVAAISGRGLARRVSANQGWDDDQRVSRAAAEECSYFISFQQSTTRAWTLHPIYQCPDSGRGCI
jgi:hypothetical protein